MCMLYIMYANRTLTLFWGSIGVEISDLLLLLLLCYSKQRRAATKPVSASSLDITSVMSRKV